MSYLIDVNVLLATGWLSHMHCQHVRSWQAAQSAFATCPLVQMGFVRVSMSPAFGVGFAEARDSLQASLRRGNHQFVIDDLQGSGLPTLTGYKEVTDAHLVLVAKRHGLNSPRSTNRSTRSRGRRASLNTSDHEHTIRSAD